MEELLQEAFKYHQSYQLKEAEELYLEVLKQDPQQADALHLLGMIAYQSQDFQKALTYYKQAIDSENTSPQFYNNLGNAHLSLNNLKEAEMAYQESLKLAQESDNLKVETEANFNLGILLSQKDDPQAIQYFEKAIENQPSFYQAYNNLGLYYKQKNQYEKAIDIFEQALTVEDTEAFDIHNNLGNVYFMKGDFAQAKKHYESALVIQSDSAITYHNLGNLYRATEDWDKAKKQFLKSLELSPNDAQTYLHMAYMSHALQDNFEETVDLYVKAYQLEPGLVDALLKFSDCFKYVNFTNENWKTLSSPVYLEVLEECLAYQTLGVDKQGLVRNLLVLLSFNHAFRHMFQTLIQHDYSQIAFDITCFQLDGLFHNKIFMGLLTHTMINHVDFETMLTILRRVFLSLWSETPDIFKKLVVHYEPFLLALAHQCFNNEFIFWCSPEEEALVEELHQELKSNTIEELKNNPLKVLMFACYKPLEVLEMNQQFMQIFSEWEGLFKKCFKDPLVEQEYLSQFEASSQTIGYLYDQNPYPRWFSINSFSPNSLDSVLKELFPLVNLDSGQSSHYDILIAGCGTGRHAIHTATRFTNCRVLAIDVSAVSLAYARRMSEELGIKNITYRQMDIKALPTLNQTFDIVECLGVLHHFQEPEDILKPLMACLKPRGFLKLGLFSQLARECVREARQFVNELNVERNLKGLHIARQQLMNLPEHHPAAEIINHSFSDFHSTSACWHLLFEENERQFNLTEIEGLLNKYSLDFLGFETQRKQIFTLYQQFCSHDPSAQDLSSWAAFEEKYPRSFEGMYQFWCQKVGSE